MIREFRFLAICMISVAFATLPIASAQTYTAVNYPGAAATELIGGPNPEGTSVGGYTDTPGGVLHGFTVTKKGVFTSFDPPGSTGTSPNFIDPQGVIVGSYTDSSGVLHGFILSGGTYKTVDFPGAAGTTLSSINPSGEISGGYCATTALCASSSFHSFVVSKEGVFTSFDPPGAVSGSETSVVIPSGAVVGDYSTSGTGTCLAECQGYLLYHGEYATINYPGSTFTFAGGANAPGDIVGVYVDATNVDHSFLLSNGVFTSFDPSFALVTVVFSEATGINPGGIIVGVYATSTDPANVFHGYIRTP
jgi:hypothetical protein